MVSLTNLTRASAILCVACTVAVGAFSTSPITRSSNTKLSSAKANTNGEATERTVHPPLSRGEVQSLLDNVPLYAVTDPRQNNGLVLLKNNQTNQEIANFFFFPENANVKYAPLRENNPLIKWEITQYPLGVIWFELIASPSEDVDIQYRLVPNKFEMASARNLVQQQKGMFEASCNEIPVFFDPMLRMQFGDDSKFPLYLGYQDMVTTAQRASRAQGDAYTPSTSVVRLSDLIEQMRTLESEIDFRNAIFVPPSSPMETALSTDENLWED